MRVWTPGLTKWIAALAVAFGIFSQSAKAQGATYQVVAFTGQTAPGGAVYQNFLPPRIGADGTIGFIEYTGGEGGGSAIYAGQPGSLGLIASTSPSDEGFAGFFDLSVSKDGFVAFNARSNDNEFAIWSDNSGGNLSGSSGIAVDPTELGSVAFRSGSLAVKATLPLVDRRRQKKVQQVLLVGQIGSLAAALTEGQLLGGMDLKEIFNSYDAPSSVGPYVDMNESGSVALKVAVVPVTAPTPTPTPSYSPTPTPSPAPCAKEAIFAGDPPSPKLVAEQGDNAPGLPDSLYENFSTKPSIANDGGVAFTSALSTNSSGPGSAVFSGLPGAILALVKQGDPVPTAANVTFAGFSGAVVNSTGDVIFRATISYPNETEREGIWIQRRTGAPVLLAISGMDLPTPSGPREVTAVDFAGPGTFNDLHEFVFKAEFSGNDQGIYVADTRPGAPFVRATRPLKPRDFVTADSGVLVAGIATDDTGVGKVEYTVAREVSATRKHGKKQSGKKRKKFIVSRVKLAKGDTNWHFNVPLSMGLNLISITATDKLGNVSEPYRIRMLRYDPDAL